MPGTGVSRAALWVERAAGRARRRRPEGRKSRNRLKARRKPPMKDPPKEPIHDPVGDPTHEPAQPFGDPDPVPGGDIPPQTPDRPTMQALADAWAMGPANPSG